MGKLLTNFAYPFMEITSANCNNKDLDIWVATNMISPSKWSNMLKSWWLPRSSIKITINPKQHLMCNYVVRRFKLDYNDSNNNYLSGIILLFRIFVSRFACYLNKVSILKRRYMDMHLFALNSQQNEMNDLIY